MSNIKVIKGNLFATECKTIVNTVNCIGVMGAGIALECKYRYPSMFEKYVDLCKNKQINIGKLWLYKAPNPYRKWVLNFPTKYDWKHPSKIEYLEEGLEKFLQTYEERGIRSIAFPLLGASNGKIPPEVSQEIMEKYLSRATNLEVEIYIYSPSAKDDLIDSFVEAITYSSPKEIQQISGLTKGNIEKFKAIVSNGTSSMMQLKRKGIGKTTLEKAFKLALAYKYSSSKLLFETNPPSSNQKNTQAPSTKEKTTSKQEKKLDKKLVLAYIETIEKQLKRLRELVTN